ncbi:hypothetical protein [Nocardia sp. NPDC051463]|uniref:hypothetical protein n=1 Tax=Nocardia sp. NPDC051463 TaxID=3154845 RepID=UPI00344E78B8
MFGDTERAVPTIVRTVSPRLSCSVRRAGARHTRTAAAGVIWAADQGWDLPGAVAADSAGLAPVGIVAADEQRDHP